MEGSADSNSNPLISNVITLSNDPCNSISSTNLSNEHNTANPFSELISIPTNSTKTNSIPNPTNSNPYYDMPEIIFDSVVPRKYPFPCKLCDKKFSAEYPLKVHVQGEHERKFQHFCKKCKQGFILRAQLNMHKKRVHGRPK